MGLSPGKLVRQENIGREALMPGDHIYSDRKGGLYYHHGIYVGNGMVIHFQAPTKGGETDSTSSLPCPRCGYKQDARGGIVKTCLDCFLSGNPLRLFEYAVSIIQWRIKRRGSCSPLHPNSPDEAVKIANDLYEGNGFNNSYNFVANNCEDFASFCKTRIPLSMQVLGAIETVAPPPVSLVYAGMKMTHAAAASQK